MPADRLYRRLREKARLRVLRADESIVPLAPPEVPDLVPTSTDWQPVPGLKQARWRCSAEKFLVGDNKGPLYYDVAFALEERSGAGLGEARLAPRPQFGEPRSGRARQRRRGSAASGMPAVRWTGVRADQASMPIPRCSRSQIFPPFETFLRTDLRENSRRRC